MVFFKSKRIINFQIHDHVLPDPLSQQMCGCDSKVLLLRHEHPLVLIPYRIVYQSC
jgi:hypothetical protein